MILRLIIALGAAFLLVAVPAGAGAADDRTRVLYADHSGYPEAVRLAVRSWNRAQTTLKLVPTDDPATVVIPIDSQRTLTGGHAALGGLLGVQISRERFDAFTLPQQATVVAHVIGHALRLPDIAANGCSVMYPAIHAGTLSAECRPKAAPAGAFRCGANRVDGRLLAATYGGRARATTGYCQLAPGRLNATVTGMTAVFTDGHLRAVISIRNSGTLPADVFLLTSTSLIPAAKLLKPAATAAVTYPMCPQVTQAQLYSPTFDALIGAPFAVPVPGC